MFVLFLYTNDFYFCFAVSWVRTAMTNSGERRKFNLPAEALRAGRIFKLSAISATSFIHFSRFSIASIAEILSAVNKLPPKLKNLKIS